MAEVHQCMLGTDGGLCFVETYLCMSSVKFKLMLEEFPDTDVCIILGLSLKSALPYGSRLNIHLFHV